MINQKKQKKKSKFKKCCHALEKMMEHLFVITIISINTVLVLIIDDIRLIALPQEADIYIDSIIFFCFMTFITEFIISVFAKEGYNFSFFFWMDAISMMSMASDIYFMV